MWEWALHKQCPFRREEKKGGLYDQRIIIEQEFSIAISPSSCCVLMRPYIGNLISSSGTISRTLGKHILGKITGRTISFIPNL